MSLNQAQAQCLAFKRTDIPQLYAENNWDTSPAGLPAIFDNWWARARARNDPGSAYPTLAAYADALGCMGASVTTQSQPPAGTTTGAGTTIATGDVTTRLWDYIKKEPALAAAGAFATFIFVRSILRQQ